VDEPLPITLEDLGEQVYRLVHSEEPSELDYLSNAAMITSNLKPAPRRQLSNTEARLQEGASVVETEGLAKEYAAQFPKLGQWVATLDVSRLDETITADDLGDGHFNLYGDPATIAAAEVGSRRHVDTIEQT
jgi:hypothetical protein